MIDTINDPNKNNSSYVTIKPLLSGGKSVYPPYLYKKGLNRLPFFCLPCLKRIIIYLSYFVKGSNT